MKHKRIKTKKEPGVLKQVLAIRYEQAKRRKALRLLEKQTWTVEFLTELLYKAANMKQQNLEMTIHNKNGQVITVLAKPGMYSDISDSDDIFDRLDDEAAVERFIRENSRR